MDEHGDAQGTGPRPTDEAEGAGSEDGGDAWMGTSGRGREWLRQLETMIDDLATQAAPTVRQIGIKAAELAAAAGDRAGPLAQRAAEVTGDAGQRIAERSRALAEELRRDAEAAGGSVAVAGAPGDASDPSAVPESEAPSGDTSTGEDGAEDVSPAADVDEPERPTV